MAYTTPLTYFNTILQHQYHLNFKPNNELFLKCIRYKLSTILFSTKAEKALNHINAPDSTTLFTISTQVAYKISHDIKHSRKSKSIVSLSAKNIVLAEKEGYDNTRTNIFHNYNSTTIKYQILTKQYFYYFCVLFNIQSSLVSPFLMIVTQFIPLIYCIVSSILVNSMSAIDSLYIYRVSMICCPFQICT